MKRWWILMSAVLVAFALSSAEAAMKLSEIADKIEIEGEVRLRGEFRDGDTFIKNEKNGEGTTDDSNLTLQRTRLGLRFFSGEKASGYIQMQDSRVWGKEDTNAGTPPGETGDGIQSTGDEATGAEGFDLKQGYFLLKDLFIPNLTLKAGRQVLSYGDQRMLGGFDWHNLAFSHDAVKLIYKVKKLVQIDLFGSKQAELGRTTGSSTSSGKDVDRDAELYGFYTSITPVEKQTVDLYVLYERDGSKRTIDRFGNAIEDTPANNADNPLAERKQMDLVYLGMRVDGKAAGLDYNGEGIYMTGNYYADNADAWAVHGSLGYTVESLKKLRFGLAYNYASGDDDPTDGKHKTFRQPYPTNYMHFGYINKFAWMNMQEVRATISAKPLDSLKVQLDGRVFWLANTNDRWYGANRQPVAGALGQTYYTDAERTNDPNNHVAEEIDFTFSYKYNKYFTVSGGYSILIAENYIKGQFEDDSKLRNSNGINDGNGNAVNDMGTDFNHWAFLMGRFAL